jgi:hypothetical protein
MVFGCTLLFALGITTSLLVVRGMAGTSGGSGPAGSAVAIAGGVTTTTANGAGASATTRPAAAGEVRGRLAGVWEGEAVQRSNQTSWTISMALQPAGKQRPAGIIAYPSLACGGELTLLAASRSEVRVREDITYGNCVDNGSIVVRQAAGGRLDWKYYLPDGGKQDAESTLQRLR